MKQREFVAIPLVVALVGILFAAASVGLWAWLLVGAVGIVVFAVLAWSISKRHRHPPARDAPPKPAPSDTSVHRVLVVADDNCAPQHLRAALAQHAAGRPAEASVVAPALGSRLGQWTGDQTAYDRAREHLEATTRALADIGVDAHGHVGSHDPIQAADDGLCEFPADEIILVVHSASSASRLEADAVEAARDRYRIPVMQVVLDDG